MLLFCLGIVLVENWAFFVALGWVANSLLNFKIASDVTFALELFCARRIFFTGYMGFGLLSVSTLLFFARFSVSRLAFALGFGVGVNVSLKGAASASVMLDISVIEKLRVCIPRNCLVAGGSKIGVADSIFRFFLIGLWSNNHIGGFYYS